jgi:Fe2+ or Zn2+ uptake regulation protein
MVMTGPEIVNEQPADLQAREWLQQLQGHGYRLTRSRQAVVETLTHAGQSLTPADIYETGRGRHKRLGLVTVYRTLEALEELGLVQRVHRPDGCHAYVPAFQGHQHLLLCQSCGRVEVFKGDDLVEFARRLEGESGFEIREHWLQFFGLCEDCH